MQNNPTPESTSTGIEINCVLWDNSSDKPVSCADVVLTSSKDGTQVYGTTDPHGKICAFVEIGSEDWSQFVLPHDGDWLIDPNTGKFPTYYVFAPLTHNFPGNDSDFKVRVDGDNKKNDEQLELYVENVFVAGKNIFIEELKRHLPEGPSGDDIYKATTLTSRLVGNALAFITHSGLTSIDSESVRHICKGFRGDDEDFNLRDNIPCSLCYTRYGSNPTRLQTCLCCAPCTSG